MKINRIIYSYDMLQQDYSNKMMTQLQSYSFKLKELEMRLKNLKLIIILKTML